MFYAGVLLLSVALLTGGAYALRGVLRLRAEEAAARRESLARAEQLLARGRQALLRHPDFQLDRLQSILESYARLPQAELAVRVGELARFTRELESTLVSRAAGLNPGDPGWAEASQYRSYSANGFRMLYERVVYPHTVVIDHPPPVTGDQLADGRIVELARRRGYRLRRQAEEAFLVSEGRHALQVPAMEAWKRMQAAAREQGVRLDLVSAYRSVARQRSLFLSQLSELSESGRLYPAGRIASGAADAVIERILRYSSIPGFSKHHTGYTIDVGDFSAGHAFTEFDQTRGFAWLAAHNYLNAKRFGFIPSYPAGADLQGPDPEPWEYVWVGEGRLLSPPFPQ